MPRLSILCFSAKPVGTFSTDTCNSVALGTHESTSINDYDVKLICGSAQSKANTPGLLFSSSPKQFNIRPKKSNIDSNNVELIVVVGFVLSFCLSIGR